MCIIVVCPPLKRPSTEVRANCWYNNDDGGGIMYPINGRVVVEKGFMTEAALNAAIDAVPADLPLVIHYRIGTAGGMTPKLTHPFQVTQDIGFAHNGVLSIEPHAADESDTSTFVTCVLRHLPTGWHTNPGTMYLVEEFFRPGNKGVIMDGTGAVHYINRARWVEQDGFVYSNSSYAGPRMTISPSTSSYAVPYGDYQPDRNEFSLTNWPSTPAKGKKKKKEAAPVFALTSAERRTLLLAGFGYAPATAEWFKGAIAATAKQIEAVIKREVDHA